MEDNAFLFLSITLVLSLIVFLKSTVSKVFHLGAFLLYTLSISISWVIDSDASAALAYWFYLLMFTILQSVVLIFQLIFTNKK